MTTIFNILWEMENEQIIKWNTQMVFALCECMLLVNETKMVRDRSTLM